MIVRQAIAPQVLRQARLMWPAAASAGSDGRSVHRCSVVGTLQQSQCRLLSSASVHSSDRNTDPFDVLRGTPRHKKLAALNDIEENLYENAGYSYSGGYPSARDFLRLISEYGRLSPSGWKHARRVLFDMPDGLYNARHFNACIAACGRSDKWPAALDLHQVGTVPTLLDADAELTNRQPRTARQHMLAERVHCTANTYSALISALGRAGEWAKALDVFRKMRRAGRPRPDAFVYRYAARPSLPPTTRHSPKCATRSAVTRPLARSLAVRWWRLWSAAGSGARPWTRKGRCRPTASRPTRTCTVL